MKHFVKLLNFEVSRFMLLFSIMMGAIVGCQFTSVLFSAKDFVNRVQQVMKDENISVVQYAEQYGKFDITFILSTPTFYAPIVFGITVLVLYVFFIWYRDWFGRANFSYRLFMLPMNRIHVYFSKLVTILLFIFTALVVEIAVLYSMTSVVQWIVPAELYEQISLQHIFVYEFLSLILPVSVTTFAFNYVLGIAGVTVVFTAIIFERSYRLKGIGFGILYTLLAVALISIPVLYQTMTSMLFINELMLATASMAIVVIVMSIFVAKHLLTNKINV